MGYIILTCGLIFLLWFRYTLIRKNRFPNAELFLTELEKLCD